VTDEVKNVRTEVLTVRGIALYRDCSLFSVVLISCRTSPAMLDSSGVDCRTPRRFTLRHKKWKYRGEGNANLVLALTQVGVIVPYFDGTVLQVCGND
jgi:hypothetical protein